MAMPPVVTQESVETRLLSYGEYLALPDNNRIIEWVTDSHEKDGFSYHENPSFPFYP